MAEGREAAAVKARELARLGAIAAESSFVFATELFGWRTFANRRQLAGSVGLTGTPYNSGAEPPASRASPRPATSACARCWWRSPGAGSDISRTSALSRVVAASGSPTPVGRARRIAIVALARKLLVALWRYLEHGIVPQGAQPSRARAAA